MKENEIFICHDLEGDTARIVSLELRYRGYRVCCPYGEGKDLTWYSAVESCQYVLLLFSEKVFTLDVARRLLRFAMAHGKEIIPLCPAGLSRALPSNLPPEVECFRTVQVSVLQTDDLFEKSIDKLIEDRFSDGFKTGRKGQSLTSNGMCLNTLRLIDVVRVETESLDECVSRVFARKIDESNGRDWDLL